MGHRNVFLPQLGSTFDLRIKRNSRCIRSATTANVPHVVGNKSESTCELMDEFGNLSEVELGNE